MKVTNRFLRFGVAFGLFIGTATTALASTITLQWDPVTAPDLAGYKVYYSTSAEAPLIGTGAVQGPSPVEVTSTSTTTITGLDPAHPYYFAVTAYNTAGVESPYSNIVSVPELIPPTVSLTSPLNNTAASGTVSVIASATDNVGVAKVEFYVNGTLQSTETATPFAYSWDTSSAPSGSYTLVAKAYDAAGNIGTDTVSVNVVHDSIPPSVSLAAPGNGSTVHGSVQVAASATDDVGITRVEFYANGALLSASNVAPYVYTWDTSAVSNGSYTLTSKAFDAAGNVGTSAAVVVNVLNDNIAPTAAIEQPAGNSTVSQTVTVGAVAADNIGVAKVEFYVDGALQATANAAPYSFQWNTLAVPNGTHTISATAYDVVGNIGQAAGVAVNVFNDTVAPAVSILSPSAAGPVGGSVTVSASATDNVAVSKVEFYLNGNLVNTASSAPYSFNWNTLQNVNGSYTLNAKAYDAAGNVGESSTITVNVSNDGMAPVVASFTMPQSSTTLTVPVTVAATDNVGITGYFISESSMAPAAESGGWTGTRPTYFTFANTGTRSAYIWAKDAAGNISAAMSASTTITFPDTTAPAITSLLPGDGSKVGANVVVSASATDNVAVGRMQLYIDGALRMETSTDSFSWSWNAKGYPKGSAHVITVRAYDAANNVTSQSVTVYR